MTITYEQATKRVEKLGLVGKLYEDRYVICNKEGTRVAEISTKYFGESTSSTYAFRNLPEATKEEVIEVWKR